MGQGASSTSAGGDPTEGLLLAIALREGHPETADLFLQKNPALAFHTDDRGNTPVHFAARSGSAHAVQLLLRTLRMSAASNT
jgi:ankyrin repeat protein